MSETSAAAGLTEALRCTIQDAYRAWLASRGFQPRRGQRVMIAEIARTLAEIETDADGKRTSGRHVCVVEAGTGTGKTLAYGLAAIPLALARGKRLVIATATVALQDQLVERDLADVRAHAGLEFSWSLAKGRGRYACPARLDRQLAGDATEAVPADLFDGEPPSERARTLYREMRDDIIAHRWDGDREHWQHAVDDATWAGTTMDRQGCTGYRCEFYRDCPYYRARERVHGSDVIVANHDLVLADLALGGGAVLPEPEDIIYVFDEGHHLADKALGHLRRFARPQSGIQTLEQTERLLGTLAQRVARDATLVTAAQQVAALAEPLRAVLRRARQMAEDLPALQGGAGGRGLHRFPHGGVGEPMRELAAELAASYDELAGLLGQAEASIRRLVDQTGGGGENEAWLSALGKHRARIEGALALWQDFAQPPDAQAPGRIQARWVERVEREGGDPAGGGPAGDGPAGSGPAADVMFQSSPLEPAELLDQALWERCMGAVVTSATLASTDGFVRFAERAGVPDDAHYLVAPASFDYTSAAALHVPRMEADPREPNAHNEAVAAVLPELLGAEHSALVIFTSWRQLEAVCEALPARERERIWSQAKLGKAEILERHRQQIDAGEPSAIFGLASFAEGIDLPGDYCRHVIIVKLPFAVPDDPVEAAVAESLESSGRNPFMTVTVPDAALRLKQACGRLLRSESDTGRITLLDPRVRTRRYGQAILDALPPYRRRFD